MQFTEKLIIMDYKVTYGQPTNLSLYLEETSHAPTTGIGTDVLAKIFADV
jgi:hypothetical protein